jgi:hypothetical protein
MNHRTHGLCRFIAAVLSVFLTAAPLTGCSADKPHGLSAAGSQNNGGINGGSQDGTSLSPVYRMDPLSFSDGLSGWTVRGYGTLEIETGTVTALGIREEPSADGSEQTVTRYALLFLGENGVKYSLPLPVEAEGNAVLLPAAAPDSGTGPRYVYYAEQRFLSSDPARRETVLCRLDRDSGTVLRSAPVDELFGQSTRWGPDLVLPFTPYFLTVASDGNVVLADQLTAVFFTPDFTVLSKIALAPDQSEGYFKAVGRSADGAVRCCRNCGGWKIETLDRTSGGFSDPVPMAFPAGNSPDLLFFDPSGTEYDCYFTTEKGIWGGRISDGALHHTLLMDYEASGVVSAEFDGGAVLFCPVGASAFWMQSFSSGENGTNRTLSVYRPADESDISPLTVVEIAHTVPLTAQMKAAIVQFNGSHPDARTEIRDYTVPGDPYAETPLAEDMAKGASKPDVIIGSLSQSGTLSIARKGRTMDLGPWLDSGDFINRDDVFGAVLSAFSTKDGGVWGLPRGFSLNTVLASPDFTGAGKEGQSWTMEEALDWFENLPAGCEGIPYLCAEAMTGFFEGASLELADRETGKSAYESPLFLRYLTWLRALPATVREWTDKSRYGAAIRNSDLEEYRSYASVAEALAAERNRTGEGDAGELYLLRTTGVMPLVPYRFQSVWSVIEAESLFGTPQWRNPGYPSDGGPTEEGGNKMILQANFVVMVSADTGAPDLCRELAEILLTCGNAADGMEEIPAFRSKYRQQTEPLEKRQMRFLFAGGKIRSEDGAAGLPDEDRNAPGIELHPAESFLRAEHMLDERIHPLLARDENGELAAILSEELSSYLTGTGILSSPERCAEKIRSRAEIWLAENR